MKAPLALAMIAGLGLAACDEPKPPPMPKGVPVSDIASGKVLPQIGLIAPFPSWAPLPPQGTVIGAEVVRPQPPYGAAAELMLRLDTESYDGFIVAYRAVLDRRGFSMRAAPEPSNVGIDRPVATYEADETQGGHVVYVTLRGAARQRYAQLTFWSPPAPHMPG